MITPPPPPPPPLQLVAGGNFRVLKEPLGFIKVLEWVSSPKNAGIRPKIAPKSGPKCTKRTPKSAAPLRIHNSASEAPQSAPK